MSHGVPAGEWVKASRKRLRLNQSDVAAYLSVRMRKSFNQARIKEMESGTYVITPELFEVLAFFFREVERLRRNGGTWQDLFPH
jgi:hypothetical protein